MEEHFDDHCPVGLNDYAGCCLCTRTYYYSCGCCRDIVDEIGLSGNCSAIGTPSEDYDYCY